MADTWRPLRGSTLAIDQPTPAPPGLMSRLLASWTRRTAADQAARPDRSDWLRQKSIALDLAYEEFCRREEQGEIIDRSEFCRRFPQYQASLHRMLLAHDLCAGEQPMLVPDAIPWPRPGQTWLDFELIEELGRGSFARVLLAREPRLGNRWVAVKISPQGAIEAKTLGKLIHPNIVPVHSVEHDPDTGLTAVCMPYLGRATLCDVKDRALNAPWPPASSQVIHEVVAAAAPPDAAHRDRPVRSPRSQSYVDAVLHLAIQLADGLAHTHAQGVLHLDLKPSNVLLSFDGTPMLLDFNLSVDVGSGRTRLGGTLPYMSPEQIWSSVIGAADFDDVADHRTDIFSLGVVLYELLTGRMPFGAVPERMPMRKLANVMLDRQRAGPLPLLRQTATIETSLADLIERCLSYNAEDRPQSAGELAEALRRHTTRGKRLRRMIAGHPILSSTAAAATVLTLAGAISFQATRAPYPERLFHTAQASLQRGDYDSALLAFDTCLKFNPDWNEARWGRAQALQELGRFLDAEAEYRKIIDPAQSGHVTALRVYCLAKGDSYEAAINVLLSTATNRMHSAESLSNLGFCFSQLGKYTHAFDAFSQSLQINPRLPAALFQRAKVDLRRSMNDSSHVPLQGLIDIEEVVRQCPDSGEAHRIACLLHAAAARHNMVNHMEPMLTHLDLAITCGIDFTTPRVNDLLLSFSDDERLRDLLSRPIGPYRESALLGLIPPDSAINK